MVRVLHSTDSALQVRLFYAIFKGHLDVDQNSFQLAIGFSKQRVKLLRRCVTCGEKDRVRPSETKRERGGGGGGREREPQFKVPA